MFSRDPHDWYHLWWTFWRHAYRRRSWRSSNYSIWMSQWSAFYSDSNAPRRPFANMDCQRFCCRRICEGLLCTTSTIYSLLPEQVQSQRSWFHCSSQLVACSGHEHTLSRSNCVTWRLSPLTLYDRQYRCVPSSYWRNNTRWCRVYHHH